MIELLRLAPDGSSQLPPLRPAAGRIRRRISLQSAPCLRTEQVRAHSTKHEQGLVLQGRACSRQCVAFGLQHLLKGCHDKGHFVLEACTSAPALMAVAGASTASKLESSAPAHAKGVVCTALRVIWTQMMSQPQLRAPVRAALQRAGLTRMRLLIRPIWKEVCSCAAISRPKPEL